MNPLKPITISQDNILEIMVDVKKSLDNPIRKDHRFLIHHLVAEKYGIKEGDPNYLIYYNEPL